jgi:hydrogenase-4 component F
MIVTLVVLAPLVLALLPLAVPLGRPRRWTRIGLAATAALGPLTLVGRIDALSLGFAGIVSIVSFLATAFSAGGATWERRVGDLVGDPDEAAAWSRVSVYYALLGAFWSAMLLTVVASTFTVLWLGISATTLATAFLVGFGGGAASLEAAWKYLVLCSVGIAFALLGILAIAHVSLGAGLDSAHALSWTAIVRHGPAQSPALARLGIALMLIGFATKAGLVPMHSWLPDAHSKAPAPVSGLLSGVLVSCALYAIVRTLAIAEALGAGPLARDVLLWLGALSTLVAGALMLAQRDLKRMLAYSTIEHAGVVALALGFGGVLGVVAALVHVVAHAFAKSAAFFATGLVQRERNTTTIGDLHALWSAGGPGRMLLGAMTALAGLPPFGIFVSELLVVVAGVAAGRWIPLAAGLAGTALAFTALARAAIDMESGHLKQTHPRTTGFTRTPAAAGAAALALGGALGAAIVPWTGLGGVLQGVASTLVRGLL